jgi:hypothetical protein
VIDEELQKQILTYLSGEGHGVVIPDQLARHTGRSRQKIIIQVNRMERLGWVKVTRLTKQTSYDITTLGRSELDFWS